MSDNNCAQFANNLCVKCSTGFIFNTNGVCTQVNAQCKAYDSNTGICLNCYLGYSLSNGICLNTTNSQDPNCASFVNQLCVKCSKGFYFGSNGQCTASNPLCLTFSSIDGSCLSCYQSFVLQNSLCVPDANNTSTDPNCASWNSGVCLACSSRAYFNNDGLCAQVSIQCNTYEDSDGLCTSCYPGFALSSGSCVPAVSPSSCAKFDQSGNCLNCSQGSYNQNGKCVQIDPQCAKFDMGSLSCLSCYPGFALLSGSCQISQVSSQN